MVYGGLFGMGRGWLFSSLLLCNMMEVRWWITIVLIFVSVLVMLFSCIWKVSFIFCMDGLCVVFLPPTVITIILGMFQPLFCISSSSGAYFSTFSCIFSFEN